MKKIFIIPGLGETEYDLQPNIKYLHLSIDDVFNLPHLPKDSILIGFSIGAIIAYFISLKQPLDKLILCSPSPIITKYRKPKAQTTILVGKNESFTMKKYAAKFASKISAKFVQTNAGHKLTNGYIKSLLNELDS